MRRFSYLNSVFVISWLVTGFANAQECLDETAVVAAERKVDTTAQFGLLGLLARDDEKAREIATALVENELAGIYKADQGVAALRARDHYQVGWWEVIQEGNARCLTEGGPPILVYRKQLEGQDAAVGVALTQAWPQCGIDVTPRCYAAKQIGRLSAAQCVEMVNRIRLLDPSWPARIGRTVESVTEECQTEGNGAWWVGTMQCAQQSNNYEELETCMSKLP